MQPQPTATKLTSLSARINLWYALILFIMAVFILRLFYLQIIKHNYYSKQALAGQLKQYEIPPVRGIISAFSGSAKLPIVLNETLYTLFADPKFIKDPRAAAERLQHTIGGKAKDYENAMRRDTRYAILAKKLSKSQKTKIDNLNIKGLGTRDEPHRTYPQGDLAAQLLGFVDDGGNGRYGLEQYLDSTLKGIPGQLKAITDAQGVPLLGDSSNVITQPRNGHSVQLTIDISLQAQLQQILKDGLKNANSKSGSALIMDPNTGAIKAMANWPTYNPSEFYKVADPSLFNNAAVSSPLEVGSVMKILTASAALDQGVITTQTSYFDPSHFTVDGYTIKNIEEDGGPGNRTLADILQLSLNTGATWMLMQMGGGQINVKARNAWYDYMSNHYRLGQLTGIEQGYEQAGTLPDPNKGYSLNLQFANTAFGQGMSATMLEMAAAASSILNGGTFYKPHLVDSMTDTDGKTTVSKPDVVERNVVKPEVGKTLQNLMEYVWHKNRVNYGPSSVNLPATNDYIIGGKTGTAQITKPGGGYYDDKFIGTFIGFVGGNAPQYIVVVRANEPVVNGYAGAKAAAPIFSSIATMLINNFGITPKSQ